MKLHKILEACAEKVFSLNVDRMNVQWCIHTSSVDASLLYPLLSLPIISPLVFLYMLQYSLLIL